MARNYSNIALDTTLTAGITALDLTCVVASAAGWPAVPFAAVLDPGSLTIEEVVEVTLKVGTTFTITRGFDGTTAAAHALGATVRHSAIAGDFTDLQAADATNAGAIAAEAGTRATDDATLAGLISAEAGIRAAADLLLAPLASPTFTGTPLAPTAAPGTNTTQLATTAFVLANGGGGGTGGGTVGGTGTPGRTPQWAVGGVNIEDSTLAKSGAGVLTLSIVGTQTWRSTANNSIGIGSGSLAAITTGSGNVALGQNALNAASTASNNFALGSSALQSCTGDSNIAIGATAMVSAGGAYTNVGIGETVMATNSTGSNNVAIGAYALLLNDTGSNNVAIGYEAGRASTGGAGVYLGFQAGYADAAANKLYIENSLSARPLIKGDFSADTLTFYATDAATAAVRTQVTTDYSSSNIPAPGFGSRAMAALASSTTASQPAADWVTRWGIVAGDATHATRKSETIGSIYDYNGTREWIRAKADGARANIGLLGASNYAGGSGVIGILDATTAPSTTPSGSHVYYSAAGLPAWRTSAGNTIGLAGVGVLTLPATGTAALLATANVFTQPQTINGANLGIAITGAASGGTPSIVASSPAQIATAVAGTPLQITASPAIAGSSVAGAAVGGDVTITAGAAARLTSGNAVGGSISLVLGAGIGGAASGQVKVVASSTQLNGNAMINFLSSGGVSLGQFQYLTSGPAARMLMAQGGGGIASFGVMADSTFGVFNWYIDGFTGSTRMMSNSMLRWSGSAGASDTPDAGIARNAAAIVEINTGNAGQWGSLKAGTRDAGTTTITDGLTLGHQSTGTPAAGLGTAIQLNINSSTTADQNAARLTAEWVVATHASRTARVKLNVTDFNATREVARFEADGTKALFSVFGTAAAGQQTGGAATATAIWTATEQGMLQKIYDAGRIFGFLT